MEDDKGNALIKFNLSEIQYLVIALVHAKTSTEHFSQSEMSEAFNKLLIDLKKVKERIIEEKNSVSS
tara:strand:- start:944 stop:1144 length:201 start_codon:yes stop_codon:yes gene_type:complete